MQRCNGVSWGTWKRLQRANDIELTVLIIVDFVILFSYIYLLFCVHNSGIGTTTNSVQLWVNKLTSTQTLFPLSYYDDDDDDTTCVPATGIRSTVHNLGQHVTGDEIRTSTYELRFGIDHYCEHACLKHFKTKRGHDDDARDRTRDAIRRDFHNNWLLDGLPSAYKRENDEFVWTRYAGGFPLGYVNATNKRVYVYNHVNLEIHYHPLHARDGDDEDLSNHIMDIDGGVDDDDDDDDDDDNNRYRIVRFIVEPFSIKHRFTDWTKAELEGKADLPAGAVKPKLVKLYNPSTVPACRDDNDGAHGKRIHMEYQHVIDHTPGQVAAGSVLYTYDVKWVENLQVHWADRWDIYLNADG